MCTNSTKERGEELGIFYYMEPALYMKQKVLLEGGLRLVKSVYSKLYAGQHINGFCCFKKK